MNASRGRLDGHSTAGMHKDSTHNANSAFFIAIHGVLTVVKRKESPSWCTGERALHRDSSFANCIIYIE